MKKNKKYKITTLIIFAIITFLLFILWIKYSENNNVKTKILKTLPFPFMLVERNPIYSTQYIQRLEDFIAISGVDNAQNNTEMRSKILNRLVFETKMDILSHRLGAQLIEWKNFLSVSPKQIQKNTILYNANQAAAKEDSFKFWFYSQKKLNKQTYQTADFLINELKAGKDFGELAKIYSQDARSRSLEGDDGPINAKNLLYELREPLLSAQKGDYVVLPSRLGVHVIQIYLKKVSDLGEDVLYLKQIYLTNTDFASWVQNETKNYHILNLITI